MSPTLLAKVVRAQCVIAVLLIAACSPAGQRTASGRARIDPAAAFRSDRADDDGQLAGDPTGPGPGEPVFASPGTARETSGKLTLALYYPWYNLTTWSDPALSDRPLAPYDGADAGVIARHAQSARGAGIDVLVCAWFGPARNNPTESNFKKLLDAASSAGLWAAIMLETDSPEFFPSLDAQRAAISHALTVHAEHSAYLRYKGKPVVFFWRPRGIWIDGTRADQDGLRTVDAWRQLRAEVDPNHSSWWIAEGDHFPYLEVFDGMLPYSIAWAADPGTQLVSYGNSVRSYAQRLGAEKLWIATAMPGYDDTRIPGRDGRFAVDRQNGDYYRRTFAGAVASQAQWINITSFNEWIEGHQIEPSASYGEKYLDLTRQLVDEWTGSS